VCFWWFWVAFWFPVFSYCDSCHPTLRSPRTDFPCAVSFQTSRRVKSLGQLLCLICFVRIWGATKFSPLSGRVAGSSRQRPPLAGYGPSESRPPPPAPVSPAYSSISFVSPPLLSAACVPTPRRIRILLFTPFRFCGPRCSFALILLFLSRRSSARFWRPSCPVTRRQSENPSVHKPPKPQRDFSSHNPTKLTRISPIPIPSVDLL